MRDRGRFRGFLLSALRHFLANEWDRAKTVNHATPANGMRMLQHRLTDAPKKFSTSWSFLSSTSTSSAWMIIFLTAPRM